MDLLTDCLIDCLKSKGYAVHNGCDDDCPELGNSAWWFTWTADGFGIETGETVSSLEGAWQSAMEHWFANAEIYPLRLESQRDLVGELLDYTVRFADMNEEPASGGCWQTIDDARAYLSFGL